MTSVLSELESSYNLPPMSKNDYFVSSPFVEGLVSSIEFAQKGMQVHCLKSRNIYPLYGVYMPTSQEYLNLFSNYVTQNNLASKQHLVELGCGSGILSIIAKENAGFKGSYTLFDINESSLECAKLNLELFGQFDNLNLQNADLVDLYFPVTGTPDP